MCIVVVVELEQCATTPIVLDSNMFLSCIWKCCVMYFMKNVLPLLSVLMKICKPCGFPIMESNTRCCSSLNVIMECVGEICVDMVSEQVVYGEVVECEFSFGCLILMLHVVGQDMYSRLIILEAIMIIFPVSRRLLCAHSIKNLWMVFNFDKKATNVTFLYVVIF